MNGNHKEEEEEKPFELDNEFILRLPPEPAASIRSAIRAEEKHWKNRLQIQLESDFRHSTVSFDNWSLRAKVYDLPTIIESHKTLDRKVFYKVADICHIMICEPEGCDKSSDEDSNPKKFDKDGREKRYLYHHGVTPCLKNVRKRRFRKTLRKKYAEVPSVEKEVKMLLKTDAEAIHSRFEVVTIEDEKSGDKHDVDEQKGQEVNHVNSTNCIENGKLREYDIFGDVSSSSDDSEEDINTSGLQQSEQNSPDDVILSTVKEETCESDSENQTEDSVQNSALASQHELEIAGRNLGQILEQQNASNNNSHLYAKLSDLEQEIISIHEEREAEEGNYVHAESPTSKQKLLGNIQHLKTEEFKKEEDYKEIMSFFQHS